MGGIGRLLLRERSLSLHRSETSYGNSDTETGTAEDEKEVMIKQGDTDEIEVKQEGPT